MGAAMFLKAGGNIHFKCRLFTGVDEKNITVKPEYLVLDGQQRLTTLYQVFMSKKPVQTCLDTKRNKPIQRYYYLDMRKCLNPNEDRLDAIISVSEKKLITEDIGRNIKLDLSITENEYKNLMFPLNLAFSSESTDWMLGLLEYYRDSGENMLALYKDFKDKVIQRILDYQIPIIILDNELPKEAICQIFENVNTGGVPLTVFEHVTATLLLKKYAACGRNIKWNDSIQRQISPETRPMQGERIGQSDYRYKEVR